VFILVANWSSLVPGIEPPTARLETDAALPLLVFLSVIWFGMRGGRRRRLAEILRRAQPGDDPAEHPAEPDAGLFHVRPPVRQCDERGVRHRHRRLAGGPAGADPA
jgi:hypothetical protein